MGERRLSQAPRQDVEDDIGEMDASGEGLGAGHPVPQANAANS